MSAVVDCRPADFDARLMRYVPGLRKLATRYAYSNEDRDDLVTDTIAYALEHWQGFREDGGFYTWLSFAMRGVAKNLRDKRSSMSRTGVTVPIEDASEATLPSSPAAQEVTVHLAQVRQALLRQPDGEILLRAASGEPHIEIAADLRIMPHRVCTVITRLRSNLRKELEASA